MLGDMVAGINTSDVARRLREVREALNPNATKFAENAGLAQNAYSQYETGYRLLTLTAAVKLCNKYRLTLDWLYRGDDAFMPSALVDKLRAGKIPKPARKIPKSGAKIPKPGDRKRGALK